MTTPEEKPYVLVWRRYARSRNYALVAILGFLPTMALVAAALERLDRPLRDRLFLLAFVAWGVFSAVCWSRFARFSCPRCGHSFSCRPAIGAEAISCGRSVGAARAAGSRNTPAHMDRDEVLRYDLG